jgi:hypothetical protein
MKAIKLTTLIMCVGISLSAQLRYENINGAISFHERMDTTQSRIHRTGNENILIRSDQDFIYLGVHSETLASVSIVLNKGDEFIVFHLSGCAGRCTYTKGSDDSLRIKQAFYDVREQPEKWDVVGQFANSIVFKKEKPIETVRTEMVACMNKFGYMGSMLDMGSYRDVEILLSKKVFKDYSIVIQNTEYLPNSRTQTKKLFYPEGIIAEQDVIQQFLDGKEKTVLKMQMDVKKWIQLSKL